MINSGDYIGIEYIERGIMNKNDFLDYVYAHDTENASMYTGSSQLAVANLTIEQIGGWVDFCAYAPDIAQHGADGGFVGFTYTADCIEFVEANLHFIMTLAFDDLPALHAVSSDSKMLIDRLAWYTLETVALWFVKWQEANGG